MMLHLQNIILEMVATGQPLRETMDRLCREMETLLPDVICSVLRVDRERMLRPLASPSLPQSYSDLIDGLLIGPEVGSCGAAAYFSVPVTVEDIATNPNWSAFKQYVLPLGLKACWSSPICDEQGAVLGTFALYFKEARGPTQQERDLLGTCLHLCVIALERHERVLDRERQAHTDALTNLGNRASFNKALAELPCNISGKWALLIIDLDNLKIANDTFGHKAGDELLKEAAVRILDTVKPDRTFRLGGDEFAVILEHLDALRDLDQVVERILAALSRSAECDGHIMQLQATVGGAVIDHDDASADSVRQKADFALYHAKETGRGGFVRYWPGIGTAITRRLTAIQTMNDALREDRIKPYYQPIFRIDTGEIVGAEALFRLITPDGKVVDAAEFCDATSDAHVAAELTDRMLAQVVVDVRDWLQQGIAFQHIGLNVAGADLHRGQLGERLRSAFLAGGVPLSHLIVEITENVYMGRSDHVIAREVAAMRGLGMRVALDDFGTGFASLTHLMTVPVDVIKIDKSFVDNLKPGNPSSVIVEGLLSIAQKIGIKVVAEGVETRAQAEQLLAYGCRLGQGYLFSKAVSRDEMTKLLVERGQPVPHDRQRPLNGANRAPSDITYSKETRHRRAV